VDDLKPSFEFLKTLHVTVSELDCKCNKETYAMKSNMLDFIGSNVSLLQRRMSK
jgi:hypothetical protein